jgi:addiction module HigA family antidote
LDARLLIHPGEILKEEFLIPFGLSANRLAKAIGVPTNRTTEIVNGRRGITGETALLLGDAFGTTPEFWLNLQSRYELDVASTRVAPDAIRRADAFNREINTR